MPMTAWFERPVTAWRYSSSLERAPGVALSPALLLEEQLHGLTRAVVWAYAEALPELLGAALDANVIPLGFSRGALTAAVVDSPVLAPGLEYVQTSSPDVCRLYAPFVPRFKVVGRPCAEALAEVGGAVRRVDVCFTEPFELEAPFEMVFQWGHADTLPHWVRSGFDGDYLIPIAPLDDDVWICWDRDHGRPRIRDAQGRLFDERHGPRDVHPDPAPPPWASLDEHMRGGEGWAATTAHMGKRSEWAVEAEMRRWLVSSSWDCHARSLQDAWLRRRPLAPELTEGQTATLVSLELLGGSARFEWIGLMRLLRLRDGRLEQLTVDHDLRWKAEDEGWEPSTWPDLARTPELSNILAKALPGGTLDRGECYVVPGDRFVLLSATAHRELEGAAAGSLAAQLGRGSTRQVARWIRTVLLRTEVSAGALVVDSDAFVTTPAWRSDPTPPSIKGIEGFEPLDPAASVEVTINELIHDPKRFHGRRIRCRGIFHSRFEGMRFADAWFSCTPPLPMGSWLVDAEGQWICDGSERGHMGMSHAELVGSATRVSISSPRVVPEDRIAGARRYVPLRSEVTLQQRLQGWTWKGDRWLTRLGPDGRLPEPSFPQQSRATITWTVDGFRNLGIFDWQIHESTPLEPEPATATDAIPKGKLVVLRGVLRCPEAPVGSSPPGLDQWTTWPTLDGVLQIVPPRFVRSGDRYAMPHRRTIEAMRDTIGDGITVTIVGEKARDTLFALSIEGPDGPLEP
jgi:hypothetical protein